MNFKYDKIAIKKLIKNLDGKKIIAITLAGTMILPISSCKSNKFDLDEYVEYKYDLIGNEFENDMINMSNNNLPLQIVLTSSPKGSYCNVGYFDFNESYNDSKFYPIVFSNKEHIERSLNNVLKDNNVYIVQVSEIFSNSEIPNNISSSELKNIINIILQNYSYKDECLYIPKNLLTKNSINDEYLVMKKITKDNYLNFSSNSVYKTIN